jgi:hypothetical protein
LTERNEFVAFAIRRVVNPGLQAALDVHRGGRWVDPPGGYEHQRGKQPKKNHADDEPSNKGSKEAPSMWVLGVCVRRRIHISEYSLGLPRDYRDSAVSEQQLYGQ